MCDVIPVMRSIMASFCVGIDILLQSHVTLQLRERKKRTCLACEVVLSRGVFVTFINVLICLSL